MKYTVITTFNADGYAKYGQRMIQTFLKTWPHEVNLIVYTENCTINESAANIVIRDISVVSGLTEFKQQWQHVPKATGDISGDPVRSQRKDSAKGFKWNAIRFAHKTYSIFHCAQNVSTDVLIWMDADTVCHSKITIEDLDRLCEPQYELCFLGRRKKFSECGLYSMKLGTKGIKRFLREFQRMYDDADNGIFLLDEWHDSFVFDAVRKNIPGLIEFDWAAKLGDLRSSKFNSPGEGHPLINSDWGAYLDHLKGARKNIGRSKREDLKVIRTEAYWQ
jgi:hypothetical protein